MNTPTLHLDPEAPKPDNRCLGDLQRLHVRLTARLIEFIYAAGYEATWGETYRRPDVALLDARAGTGIKNSLHTKRLAVDLQLFKNQTYLTTDADGIYKQCGHFWQSLDPLCRWGGNFTTRDYNHFSIEWQGVE